MLPISDTIRHEDIRASTEGRSKNNAGYSEHIASGARILLRWLNYASQLIMVISIVASCLLIFASIIARAISGSSILWADDAAALSVGTIAIFGGVSAYCRNEHVGLKSAVRRLVGNRCQGELNGAVSVSVALFATIVAWKAAVLASTPGLGTFGSLQLPTEILYLPLAAGASLLAIAAVASLAALADRIFPYFGVLSIAILGALFWLFQDSVRGWWDGNGTRPLIAAFALVAFSILIGVPIAFALAFGTILGIYLDGQLSLSQIPLQMTNITLNLALIALPFFILAGAFLGAGDIPMRLMAFVRRLGGGGRASEGIAAVIGMYIFSGLSGSKMGDIAAVAPGLVGKRDNTTDKDLLEVPRAPADPKREEMAGILGAAAVMGEAVPPCITMLVLGAVTTISTEGLFVAGLLPAAFIGVCIVTAAALRAKRLPAATGEGERRSLLSVAWRATPPLLCILIIAVGIIGGYATPSEASSIAAVYCGLLITLFYRLGLRQLYRAITAAARLAGMLLFMISITGALSWFLTISGLTKDIHDLVALTGHSRPMFMAVTVVALIILGSTFEGMPAILIFAPLLVPEAGSLGINLLQYGIVLLLSMGVGNFMPPLGICFYATNAIVGVDSARTWRPSLVYLGSVVVGVLILAFVPNVATVLPNILHIK